MYGFLEIHPSHTLAVEAAFGKAEAVKQQYFKLDWVPSMSEIPVRVGDTLSCLLVVNARVTEPGERSSLRVRQLVLEKCGHLTKAQMLSYLTGVQSHASADPEKALILMGKCGAPWRYILDQDSADDDLVALLLDTLVPILRSNAMLERRADLVRSFGDSRLLGKDGAIEAYLRAAEPESDEAASRLALVSTVVLGTLSVVPAAARAFYHLIEKFYRSNDALLLSVIQRLLPADARVEQLLWHELPLVISAHELLGEVDPLLQTPSVVVKGPYESPTEYFDANFRLMRHEGFGELRNGISSLLRGKLDVRDMNVYKDVAVHGVRFGISERGDDDLSGVHPAEAPRQSL